MPYHWTRPRRRAAFAVVFWFAWAVLLVTLWGVTRVSWISYSQVPYFNQMGLPVNAGRKTTVLGVMNYLTIDRDMVDYSGKSVTADDPVVRWTWKSGGIVWSGIITIASAVVVVVMVRVGTNRYPLAGRCDECAYDLTGLDSGRCPECGHAVESSSSGTNSGEAADATART